MPNKEGGYGGYRREPDEKRTVRHVRTNPGAPGEKTYYRAPYTPGEAGRDARPAKYNGDTDSGWLPPEKLKTYHAADAYRTAPRGNTAGADHASRTTQTNTAPRTSRPPQASSPAKTPPPRRPVPRSSSRRRLTQKQKKNRSRLILLSVVLGIFILAGIITALLPQSSDVPADVATAETATLATQLVAPMPYSGSDGTTQEGGEGTAPVLNWGVVGPRRVSEAYTYTAAQPVPVALPEMGNVDNSWFADAAFLGDSLTVGFSDYGIDVSGALICGYEGTSPNQIVNRTTLKNSERGEEIPLEVLGAAQPAKLYVLLGTNALVGTGNDDGFLNYYGRMLDELRSTLPNTTIFVQSVLPVRPEALDKAPGLASDRLASINAAIASMCAEKGCYYLDLEQAVADESGALSEDIAQPDGIHLTVAGYARWVGYLTAHTPFNINNPYKQGSAYYLDDSMKQLLADIP